MAANESTKFQINYKLPDGTLVNLYAKDVKDLETGLADLGMVSALVRQTSQDLSTSGGSIANLQRQLNATVVSDTESVPDGNCKHGKLVYRTSKPGAPKEWKGWFCPSPQGTPDQCSPKFIR